MSDVVEQGSPERPPLPAWVRALAVLAAAVGVVFLLSSGLLSADRPDRRAEPAPTSPSATATAEEPEDLPVVFREGDRLLRFDAFGVGVGAFLPSGLPQNPGLTVVPLESGGSALVTAAGGRLYRIEPATDQIDDLTAASRVVDAARPGEVVVQLDDADGSVVTLAVGSGEVVDPQPFAERGQARSEPVGVLSLFGAEGLVLRGGGRSGEDDLSVAWATAEVDAGRRPAQQSLGTRGRLLGLTDESVLLLRGRCPGEACRLAVVSFTGRDPVDREVRPPAGWSFTPYAGGLTRGPLVPVVPLGEDPVPGSAALARLAAGGESALLVEASVGALPEAGLVEQAPGEVYFVRLGREGIRRVFRWDPATPGRVSSLGALPPLPDSGRLVCVCQ